MSATKISGLDIKLIRSDVLPSRTMIVSPDLYDMLADEGKAAESSHARTMERIEEFSRILKGMRK